MINTVIIGMDTWGYKNNKYTFNPIKRVIHANNLKPKLWFRRADFSLNLPCECEEFEIYKWCLINDLIDFSFPPLPYEVIQHLKKYLAQFAMLTLRFKTAGFIPDFDLYHLNTKDINELFGLWISYFWNRFKKYNIQLVLFEETPGGYGGVAYLAYIVAEYMDIPTLILQETALGYTIYKNLKNLSKINTNPILSEGCDLSTHLSFYNKNIKPYMSDIPNLSIVNKAYLNQQYTKLLDKKQLLRLLIMNKLKEMISIWNYDMATLQIRKVWNMRLQNVFEHIAIKEPIYEVPYVYYPLHLQPEVTSNPLGGDFVSELDSILYLRSHLPNKIAIYVKENPKQEGGSRGSFFIKSLQAMENVFYLHPMVESKKLLENSLFVATLSGTVGIEAVFLKKYVVVFGYAYYQSLPHVYYYDDINWDIFLNQTLYTLFPANVTDINKLRKHFIPFINGWHTNTAIEPDEYSEAEWKKFSVYLLNAFKVMINNIHVKNKIG